MANAELPVTVARPPEIPGYQLLETIGEGGMGTVYRAVQLSLQRPVAVKFLARALEQPPALAFERESRLMASLAHPNLVTVFDCGQVQDSYFIVTELVDGSTLRQRIIPGKPWSVARASALLDRIARALSYIHAKGILHLDLKPENILGDEDGEPKIADFGLALTEVDAAAEIGPAQGTPDYCAPEQRFGLPTNERSDLFSLAVLAYELLTGQLPGRVYESACEINSLLPHAVDAVLRHGLERSPEDRYATVAEFRRDLMVALEGPMSRARRRLAIVAGIGLILFMTAIWIGSGSKPADPDAPAPAPLIDAWVLHDRPDELRWFDQDGTDEVAGPRMQPLLVQGRAPVGAGMPSLPLWPNPRPVLVISSPGILAFVHPLQDSTLGRRVLRNWSSLLDSPSTLPEDNFCRAGNFGGDSLADNHEDNTRPWHLFHPELLKGGDVLALADPPDQVGNPALLMVRKDSPSLGEEFGCYQWLARIPERERAVVVMRYRARAEEGEGRLCVRVQLPLLLPVGGQDEAVRRLRGVSVPFADLKGRPDQEPRQYRLDNWVTPGREWQTYYTIFEWPAYCQDPSFRNLVVFLAGTGKVWVDDIEVFTWELGGVK